MSDQSLSIASLIMENFNLRQARANMYVEKKPYLEIPALYFHLKEDNNTVSDYQLINNALETFNGNLKWHFGKSYPSRINYEIIPEIVRSTEDKYFTETDIAHAYQNIVSTSEFKETCELAIADIPYLYQHMKEYFEKHKPLDKE